MKVKKSIKSIEEKKAYCEKRARELLSFKKTSFEECYQIAEREWDKKHTTMRKPSFKIFFTSDLHFGHFNILRYDNRPFISAAEMDEEMINRWNETVGDNDMTIIAGDISWYDDAKTAAILKRLNGRKVLVKGNHDNLGPLTTAEFYQIHNSYLEIKDYETGKNLIISHYPIHFYNGQRKGAIMLYGHVHNGLDDDIVNEVIDIVREKMGVDFTMINIGCMHWDYRPKTLSEMLKRKERS